MVISQVHLPACIEAQDFEYTAIERGNRGSINMLYRSTTYPLTLEPPTLETPFLTHLPLLLSRLFGGYSVKMQDVLDPPEQLEA